MKVLNLCCGQSHVFEGWFASEDDYLAQRAGAIIACPLCGDTEITKLPSAPRLNLMKTAKQGAEPCPLTLQSVWARVVEHVIANTVDVGDQFAEEARRIHYREAEERAIRGRATPEDVRSLEEEGIEVAALPLPPVPDRPTH
jgi:hypothetical protein